MLLDVVGCHWMLLDVVGYAYEVVHIPVICCWVLLIAIGPSVAKGDLLYQWVVHW